MEKINLDSSRFLIAEGNIRSAFAFCNDKIPFIVNTMSFWLDGEDPSVIPDDYFTNPASMLDFQCRKIDWHLKNIDDDYIPFLHPWFGTVVVPSAVGGTVVYPPKLDPALKGSAISRPEQVYDLKPPDPYRDGLMPKVLEYIDYMKINSNLPICVTDTQGPLNIALSIAGVENLFIWFYTHPDEAHHLMDFSTNILIDWIKVQKKHAGIGLFDGAFPHGIKLPSEFGGVCLSDDDCTQLPADLYNEFVVPYNSRVLKAFGGGTIHFCGTSVHQIENLLLIEGLTGVNNFCMGNFTQIYKMQKLFADKKIFLMVCDFAPLHPESYYNDLFQDLKVPGTFIASFPAYSFALQNGKYEQTIRHPHEVAKEIYGILKKKNNQ